MIIKISIDKAAALGIPGLTEKLMLCGVGGGTGRHSGFMIINDQSECFKEIWAITNPGKPYSPPKPLPPPRAEMTDYDMELEIRRMKQGGCCGSPVNQD